MMKSKTLYLVRHGLSTHSKRGYGKRRFTAPLLPEGIPAIQKMAEMLKDVRNSLNVSSEIIRCRETSAIISEVAGKQFTFDERLNEAGFTETVEEVRNRVDAFLNEIERLSQTNIIICTHGKIIAAIKNLVISNTFKTSQFYDYTQTGELLIIENRKTKKINFN